SLTKAWLRVCGIVLGGGAALVALVSCADKPWVLFPLQALILAVVLFLSRTTTAPYACALFGLVFYIVVPEFISVPAASLERGLWIIFSLAVGAFFGTLSQLAFWPDDPEELLLIDGGTIEKCGADPSSHCGRTARGRRERTSAVACICRCRDRLGTA